MPGYVIHLAVGKEYAKNNKIENIEEFEKGIIAPDLLGKLNKEKTHYGSCPSKAGFDKFLKKMGIETEYNEGYFLHLLTDYLFYNNFLEKWTPQIYDDYDKLNKFLIEKYQIDIPSDIKEIVKFKEGELSVLDKETLCKFIECVGKINIRELLKKSHNILEKIKEDFEL